jgi:hypothetical protein
MRFFLLGAGERAIRGIEREKNEGDRDHVLYKQIHRAGASVGNGLIEPKSNEKELKD